MTTLSKTASSKQSAADAVSSRSFSRFIKTLAISPAVLIAASFGFAVAFTQFIAPGTTGGEALVLSAVIIGLIGGFFIAKLNPDYRLPAALYSASLTGLMYLSIRLFWFTAPMTLMGTGFLLIIPAAVLGAYTAAMLAANPASNP